MSSKFDPQHERTLLVMTKIDQTTDGEGLDKQYWSFCSGDDAFNGHHVFLVRNRTFKENESNAGLKTVRENEQLFFDSREDMIALPDSCKGIKPLTETLAHMQTKRMLHVLPELQRSIDDKLLDLQQTRKKYPTVCKSEHQCRVKYIFVT